VLDAGEGSEPTAEATLLRMWSMVIMKKRSGLEGIVVCGKRWKRC